MNLSPGRLSSALRMGSALPQTAKSSWRRAGVRSRPWPISLCSFTRLALERPQARRDAGDVVAALLAVADDPALGPPGRLLMGHAYRELGMIEELVATYEKALPEAHGLLAAEMACTLADC